jgi:hypothetical protein
VGLAAAVAGPRWPGTWFAASKATPPTASTADGEQGHGGSGRDHGVATGEGRGPCPLMTKALDGVRGLAGDGGFARPLRLDGNVGRGDRRTGGRERARSRVPYRQVIACRDGP